MIGKISSGSNFAKCVEYALAENESTKEAKLLFSEGVMDDSSKSIIAGFECQRQMNKRVEKWVGHISLSYSPEDSARLSDDAMVMLAQEYLVNMGIVNTQYIITRHLDKEHPHCHIVYNRVDNDGKCISDSNERLRNKEVCKALKKKYGLTFGNGKEKVKTERLRGGSKTRQEIYLAVQAAKRTAKDWIAFQRQLAQSGINVRKKFKRGTTEVEGLSYTKDGRRFKASQIDRDGKCSYKTICEAIDRNKKARTQIPSAAPKPQLRPVKTIQNISAKTADSVAEIAADMAGGLGNIVNIGPGFDPQEEEFIREMQRRKRKRKAFACNVHLKTRNMNNDNFDNTADSYLGNIAEELSTISGTCTEIKETQLNSATVEDVERVGNDVKAAIDSNIKSLDKSISEPWGILNDWRNCMDNNTLSNRETVEEAEGRICDRFDDMESHLTEKLDAITAKPPVREVVHHVAKESWQWYLILASCVGSFILFFAIAFWQEGRIEQCRTSDIKYHFIQMCGGISPEGLDSIESWFQNPDMVKRIEKDVREYQDRVQETARTLQQKKRLEERLNELNAETDK